MPTIASLLDEFLAALHGQLSANSRRAYRADLRIAGRYLPGSLDQLTTREIDTFLALPICAPATMARRGAALTRFLDWSVRAGHLDHTPLRSRERVALVRRLPRPIPLADRAVLDRQILNEGQPYRVIFTVLRETGMRVAEVLGLDVGDVLLDAGREGLRVQKSKNRSERVVVLGSDATPLSLRALRAHLRRMEGRASYEPLFVSNRATRVAYTTLHDHWSALCRRGRLVEADKHNGGERLRYTIHQLRHTRGTELIEQGLALEVVQRALGHADIRSTQGYAELSDERLRSELARGAKG